MTFTIMQGDNRDTLKTLEDASVDAIVTDPPYGIDFLGKAWDANTGALETYRECLRVLKPGGYILAFSAARTYHHLAVTLEQAGFEIRDQLMWLYSSGFPKAQDIGKAIDKRAGKQKSKTYLPDIEDNRNVKNSTTGSPRCVLCDSSTGPIWKKCNREDCIKPWEDTPDNEWAGWKTALKPAHEPIAMARKPFKGSTIDNVLKHGVGALNIDATRIGFDDADDIAEYKNNIAGPLERSTANKGDSTRMFEGKTGFKAMKGSAEDHMPEGRFPSNVLGEVEGYQKFFYCPKVSRKERHIGYDTKDIPTNPEGLYDIDKGSYIGSKRQQANNTGNNHPTVKPVALMRYLVKLVTPPNSTVLDPFCGSGSTGMAAVELGHTFIGCELDKDYVDIATTRIEAWNKPEDTGNTYNKLFEEVTNA